MPKIPRIAPSRTYPQRAGAEGAEYPNKEAYTKVFCTCGKEKSRKFEKGYLPSHWLDTWQEKR